MIQSTVGYNLEAEAALFGILFQEPDRIKDINVKPGQLSPGRNSNLLATMIDLDNKKKAIDPLSIFERVGPNNIDRLGGISHMTELASGFFSVSKFDFYQTLIVDAFNERKKMEVAEELKNGMDLGEAITKLSNIQDIGAEEDDGDIREALVDVYEDIQNSTGELTGIPSGFRDMDKLTGGWKEGDLIIIGGRPSMGKTAYALNLMLNAAATPARLDGDIVAVFSLEMSKKQLLKRAAAMIGHLDMQEMKTAGKTFTENDWNKLSMAVGFMNSSDVRIFDQGRDLNYIYRNVRKLRRKNPDRRILVLVDYLQLIVGSEKHQGNRTQEISEISRELKHMAREFKISVAALSQLSRNVEMRQDKRPMMSDLRESGQIEQDADIIQFLYRDDYYNAESEDSGITEIIMAKHRDGPTGTIKLAFVKEYGKFVSIDWGGR